MNVDIATTSVQVGTAHADRAAGQALSLLDEADLRTWERTRWRNQLAAVVGNRGDNPPEPPESAPFMSLEDAVSAARTGNIDGALAFARTDRERSGNWRIREQIALLTEIAAARIRAGDVQTARHDLDRIVADIAANRNRLARGVDHSWHYYASGALVDVAAVLAQAGESARARDMYAEAVAEAAKVGPWDVYPFKPASPDDPNPFDTFGSGAPVVPTGSNPLAENYIYIRALALHGAACAAAAAGFPVDPAEFREAAFPTSPPADTRGYSVRLWVAGAVALSLVDRGCTAEGGTIPPRGWMIR